MFVDSASRLQRPYRTRDKSAAAILAVVNRFIADIGAPRALRSDNGAEHTNHSFVEYCNNLGIRRKLTAPYTPQQNGPVESALWRAFNADHGARLEVSNIYPDIRLYEVVGSTDVAATSLWMESLLWASECSKRSATVANDGWLSPHEIFYGNRPPLLLLLFLQPAYHRLHRRRKSDPRARLCYFLNFGYNHGHDCHKLLDAETRKVVFSRDVTWHHPEAPLIPPATAVGIRPLRHRRTSMYQYQRLCPASLRPSPLQYRRLHHRRLSPLLRRHPHYLRHHRLYLCRTPRLRSPRALAANLRMRDTWGCPGGRVARPVQCAMHHGNTSIAMVYHWTMWPWCRCWRRVKP